MATECRIPLRARDGSIRDYALVDREDYDRLSADRWSLRSQGYAARGSDRALLHRVVLRLTPADPEVDHRNLNKLDCRRSNLRILTRAQNAQNQPVQRNNATGIRGVSFDPARGTYRASVMVNGHRWFARFRTAREAEAAVVAYRRANAPFSEADRGE